MRKPCNKMECYKIILDPLDGGSYLLGSPYRPVLSSRARIDSGAQMADWFPKGHLRSNFRKAPLHARPFARDFFDHDDHNSFIFLSSLHP
jgi:hypothetical protein